MNHPNQYPIDALELHNPPLTKDASLKGNWLLLGSVGVRKWAALGLIGLMLAATVATSAAFGQTHSPCYQAYLMSGFNQQQVSFEEFRGLYSDTSSLLCAPGSGG